MADSSLSYLAGVSVERNINEAIRVEEQRAHASQVRSLHAKIAGLQDDLAFYKEQTEEFRKIGLDVIKKWELKNAVCNAQEAELAKANARIQALEERLAKEEAHTAAFVSVAVRADSEVRALVKNVLPSILAGVEAQHGISLAEQAEAIKAQAEAACPLTFDFKFNRLYRFALVKHIRDVQQANGGMYETSVEESAAQTKLYNELLASHRG
mgnify:CR=1 FL=1